MSERDGHIRALAADEAAARLDELAALLVDAVAGGASVNFLSGLGLPEARAFWAGQISAMAHSGRLLFAAVGDAGILGTTVLTFAPQPNAPHRAEVTKMLVARSCRRRGIGRRLLSAVEAASLAAGRTLLVLDTEAGSEGDRLYRACGWTAVGTIPGFALTPTGRPADATVFFKDLAPAR